MAANLRTAGSARRSVGERARDIVRVNSYASFAAAVLILAVLVPPGGRAGPSRLGLAGLAAALLLAGGDELMLAVGRRLRRWHLVPFAVLNAVCASACAAVLARTDGLPIIGQIVIGTAAVLFGAFAILETRAARSL